MTNWSSFVPFSYKKASVVSMIQRAISVCSSYSLLAVELDEIRRICQLNGYPRGFVDTRIGIGLTKYLNKKQNDNNNSEESNVPVAAGGGEKDLMYVEVPFIGDQTDLMKRKLQRLSETIRPDLDVRFYAKPPRAVRTFFPNKAPVPKHLQSNTVYAVTCEDYGDTYVGMTKRQTITRLNEHGAPKNLFDRSNNNNNSNVDTVEPIDSQQQVRTSKKTSGVKPQQQQQQPPVRRSSRVRNQNETLATTVTNDNKDRESAHVVKKRKEKERTKDDDNPSSIAEHVQNTGHKMDWRNFRVLWRDNSNQRLLIKESLVIRAYEPRLNRTTHSVPLLIFPEGLERHLVPDPNG
jgi:predicted GIY-YIG superfamily endonuclease